MPALLRNGIYTLLLCTILVTIAYCYIDAPVAFWIHDHHIDSHKFLKWLTKIPEAFCGLLLGIYVLLIIMFCYNKTNRFYKIFLATANSIAIAYFLKDILKIVFSRYWPLTWVKKNLSLIHDGAYGFNWFHGGASYAAFPSGHTTVTVAAMTILWIVCPYWGWLSVLTSLLVMIGLVGLNYHFVGDVIGGAFLGGLTAYYTAKISGIEARK